MKISAGDLEAAFRRKRQPTGESSRPAKRPRRRDPARPAIAPSEPAPAGEPAKGEPVVEAAPRPVGAEIEEGEIPVITEATVVILDDEDTLAAAAVPEAGRVTIAAKPIAAEPVGESAHPTTEAGEPAARRAPDGAGAATETRRDEAGGLPRQPPQSRVRRPIEGPGNVRLVPRIGSMADAVQAHGLVAEVRTDEFAEEMRGMSHSDLLDLAMVSIVQMGNAAIGLRDALAHSSETLGKALAKADRCRREGVAQAESLARLQRETAAREEGMAGRLKEMEGRAEAANCRAAAAEARAELASEKLKAALERAAAAEKAAAEAAAEKAGAVACADEASARAGEAEDKAREAEARAQKAEDKARRAEAGAGRAVADFKASEEFKQEVIEGSLDAYAKGFEVCKARIATALEMDIAEFEDILPGADEDSADGPDEEKTVPGEP